MHTVHVMMASAESSKLTGERFTLFYGSASPFSQWHPAKFTVDGVEYNCAEQYMMHQKAVLFGDMDTAALILHCDSPREQKALGRKVQNFNEKTWKEECRELVMAGNKAKFFQNPSLREALVATADTTLVEASPRDTIWGIGLSAQNPKAKQRQHWRGTNWLGEVLMDVREELLQEQDPSSKK